MAINKKGSRRTVVDNVEFRWRATGNDGWITLVIWPSDNESSRIVASAGYHSNFTPKINGVCSAIDQIVITNRMVREVILHVGTNRIIMNQGQIDIGSIEQIFDMEKAVRSEYAHKQ